VKFVLFDRKCVKNEIYYPVREKKEWYRV